MAHRSSAVVALRSTQRAPRSCLSCSSRKVKCDKSVPCSRCIKRGQAESCVREMVLVRGQVTTFVNHANLVCVIEADEIIDGKTVPNLLHTKSSRKKTTVYGERL